MTTTVTYSVTYVAPSDATEETANALAACPSEDTLASVIETCVSLGVDAVLRDPAGFRAGSVSSAGAYSLG